MFDNTINNNENNTKNNNYNNNDDAFFNTFNTLKKRELNTELINELIRLGTPNGVKNQMGFTALHLAVLSGASCEVVQLLINNGENIEDRTNSSKHRFASSLHLAAFTGNESLVRFLLSMGADIGIFVLC